MANYACLNVNDTGSKPIYYRGKKVELTTEFSTTYENAFASGHTHDFIYDASLDGFILIGDLDRDTTYSDATISKSGLLSPSDKIKLNNISESASSVSFSPDATEGNKVGTITINGTSTDMYSPVQTDVSGNAGTATKLADAKTIRTDLASTSSASFDGSANVTPGVTGTLPIGNGGTGATTAAEALSNLGGLGYTNVTTTGTNLNDYTQIGIYYFSSSYTPSNIPTGSNGWLLVLPYSSTICKQIWFRHGATDSNDFNTFVRTNSGGTWSSWAQLLTSKNCTTEANIISKKNAPELLLQATGTSNPAFYMMRDADSTSGTTNDWRMYSNASGTLAIQYRAGDSGSWTKGLYLTSNGGLVINASNYGSTLPSSGTTGQVFFKI